MEDNLLKQTHVKLQEFARFLEEDLKENLMENYSSGELEKSIKVKVNPRKFRITLSFAEHGIYLDEGTDPHWVPVSECRPGGSLYNWATFKGYNVWAVRESIATEGTKPHPWLYTWDSAEFNKKLKTLLGKGLKSDMDKWVKNIDTDAY